MRFELLDNTEVNTPQVSDSVYVEVKDRNPKSHRE